MTPNHPIHGFHKNAEHFGRLATYGSDATEIEALIRAQPELADRVHEKLPLCHAEIVWACREEMARTVDDVLARRSRCLLLDARAAAEAAPAVAKRMAAELGRDERWTDEQTNTFAELASRYRPQ